ncbi:MAG: hypothetical protein KY475_26965 [Planctomycetes bacterium]|nr:hypothetical protein [Planctomycetota bacterium]
MQSGEMVSLDVRSRGVAAVAGAGRDDPTLRDICDDAYRARDAELQQ